MHHLGFIRATPSLLQDSNLHSHKCSPSNPGSPTQPHYTGTLSLHNSTLFPGSRTVSSLPLPYYLSLPSHSHCQSPPSNPSPSSSYFISVISFSPQHPSSHSDYPVSCLLSNPCPHFSIIHPTHCNWSDFSMHRFTCSNNIVLRHHCG